jgi:hypothetical protein
MELEPTTFCTASRQIPTASEGNRGRPPLERLLSLRSFPNTDMRDLRAASSQTVVSRSVARRKAAAVANQIHRENRELVELKLRTESGLCASPQIARPRVWPSRGSQRNVVPSTVGADQSKSSKPIRDGCRHGGAVFQRVRSRDADNRALPTVGRHPEGIAFPLDDEGRDSDVIELLEAALVGAAWRVERERET